MSKIWLNATHKPWLIGIFLLALYPALVLGYVWYHCFISEFKYGRHGSLDAYRHTLASAVVAYTLSPVAVELFTNISEASAGPSDLMDKHNNRIGSNIGLHAQAFAEINVDVIQAVRNGAIKTTNPNQITWMPTLWWEKGLFW
ncbi:MAG: hypothetical protein ABL933_11375 [Methyloglobulus sp.]|nr:hypothetical protein [Methyloglobulus sp.]